MHHPMYDGHYDGQIDTDASSNVRWADASYNGHYDGQCHPSYNGHYDASSNVRWALRRALRWADASYNRG